jgi:hypothetical protein
VVYICNRFKIERAISSVGSEHLVYTEGVGGSNPSSPTTKKPAPLSVGFFDYIVKVLGSLTQLVQSVTSTTWKSLVRIQYDPHYAENLCESIGFFISCKTETIVSSLKGKEKRCTIVHGFLFTGAGFVWIN